MIVEPTAPPTSRICERLSGQHVLITGATGFLAKIIVEKLLRAVPQIGGLYLLVRPRSDGTSAEQRVRREVLGSNAFDRLRAALGPAFEPHCRAKIEVVQGDLVEPHFGLDDAAYERLARRITLVVNSAATVTFDERLDLAVRLNIEGTRRLLQFAKDCGNIPFSQVSTAYVSGVQTGDVPEQLIPPGHTVATFMAAREAGNGSRGSFDLDAFLAELGRSVSEVLSHHERTSGSCRRALIELGMSYAHRMGWHDTYTMTKWMAEQILARDRGDVPLVIFRPAIIEGSYDEPAPGWIDGLRMADPLILAFGRGKLKDFPADPDVPLDLIPVDFVANALIATLPAGRTGPYLEVYQCSSSARNRVLVREVASSVEDAFEKRPIRDESGRPIRVSSFNLISRNRFLQRWERRLRLVRRARSILRSVRFGHRLRKRLASTEAQVSQLLYFVKIYAPYTHLNCRFRDDRLQSVWAEMSPEDRATFPFDVSEINWHEYLVDRHVPGVRHFVLGSGTELEAPMLAASWAVEDEAPNDPPPMQVLSALRGESIFEVFENAANAYPKRIALQVRRNSRWVRYTYEDALATVGTIARRFVEYGLAEGDHVAICADNSPEWGLTYLGAVRQGLVVVPFDPQIQADELLAMARFADVKLICADAREAARLRSAASASGNGGEGGAEGDGRGVEGETGLPCPIVELDATFVPPPLTARDPGPEPASVHGDALASIVFTSGTTVAPKGVMLRHRNFLSNARSLVQMQPIQKDDQFLSVLPMHHVFEFTGGFLVPMANASTVTYAEERTPAEIVSLMQATGTTVMMVVPRILQGFRDRILREVESSGRLTRLMFHAMSWLGDRLGEEASRMLFGRIHRRFGGRLRLFVCGGSALPVEVFHFFKRIGLPVCEGYGLTETAPVLTVNPAAGMRAGSVGLPLPEVELEIRNQDAEGVGELWVRGPNRMEGYYKNEASTREVILDDWFRTGDLCRRDADGYLYVTGRVKEVIITPAGKNVYPDEVEYHFRDLNRVKELCVLGMPKQDGFGESVDAVIVLDLESVADVDRSAVEDEVRRAVGRINDRLASYQRVENIHFWTAELPKTSTLKVKRAELRRLLLGSERPDRVEGPPPATVAAGGVGTAPAEQSANDRWLREALARLAHVPVSRVTDDANLLLDLGVDSLMKVELLGEIEHRFGFKLPEPLAARIGRVADLTALVAHRTPVCEESKSAGRASFSRSVGGSEADGWSLNGTPLALKPLRWMFRGGTELFFHSWVRVRSVGTEHLPADRAFVLAANHCSHLDALSVMTAISPVLSRSGRRMFVAGAEDYFFNTRTKAVIFGKMFDTIPFNRHSDGVDGLRRCAAVLREGQCVLIFPEGTRSVSGAIQPFKIGAAVLSSELSVPIVPVRIENTFGLMPKGSRFVRPGVVTVRFGRPIEPPELPVNGDAPADARFERFRMLATAVEDCVKSLGRPEATVDD